jgi:uncharacterized membrane protein
VAPSFIFISGFVFMVAAQRKLEEYRQYGKTFWRQLGRIGLVWTVGYYLHMPFFSLQRTLHETTENTWLSFFQADVLHCIALGLLVLFLLRLLIKDDRTYSRVLLVLAVVCATIAPFIWEVELARYVHPALAAYGNGLHFSQFPVFPWLAFMLAGGYLAAQFLTVRGTSKENEWFRTVFFVGAGMIIVGLLNRYVPIEIPAASQQIRANPFFVIERLGIVAILLVLCRWWAEWRHTERSFVIDAGRESLLLYAVHLLIIYGQFWNDRSLSSVISSSWGIGQCVVGTIALAMAMILLGKLWSWLKREQPAIARLGFAITVLGSTIGFLIR